MNLIEKIRSRSREDYQALVREQLTQLRIWLQEHGELALLIGLVAGIVVVEAFQLIALLLMTAAVVGLGVWLVALPRSQHEAQSVHQTTQNNPQHTASPAEPTQPNGSHADHDSLDNLN